MTLAALAAATVLAAGCSSSGGGSGGASTGSTSSASVPVGAVATLSGPQAGSQAGEKLVLEAWSKWVNAHGGVKGHPVKLYLADDKGDASAALTAAKKLISENHVVAIIDGSNFDAAWGPTAATANVPVLGGDSFQLSFLTNSDFFPGGANAVAVNYGLIANAKTLGPRFAYLYCAGSPICAQNAPIFKEIAAKLGVKVLLSQSVPEASADYTPQCTTLKEANVDSYSYIDASNFVLKLVQTCKSQGLKAPLVTLGGTMSPAWLTSSATDGTLSSEGNFPFVDTSNAAAMEFQSALKQYAPNLGAMLGSTPADQWVGGKLFEAAVAAAPSGPITAASVKEGLYSLKNETLGGLAPPLTYTKGSPARINCYFVMKINGGTFTEPNGLQTKCAPDSLVDAIIKNVGIK